MDSFEETDDSKLDERMDYEFQVQYSKSLFEHSRNINLISSLVVSLIGLFGNILIIIVFTQKKFRSNSGHIYLLCSAINDNLFIIIHLFEDTLRSYKDLYSIDNSYMMNMFNLTDRNHLFCKIINYLRYLLRFVSSYIVVAFTMQRLYIVYKPLSANFMRKQSAWRTVLTIVIISFTINLWVPFIFQISYYENENDKFCNINNNYKKEYFVVNIIYICLIMFIPMLTITICNILIIFKTSKSNSNRKRLQIVTKTVSFNGQKSTTQRTNTKSENNSRIKPHYWTLDQVINRKRINPQKLSKKLTFTLVAISFSFVALNFPYLIGWAMFFYKATFNQFDLVTRNYLFSVLHISEIFYLLNYGLKFFIFCCTESSFQKKLKNLSESVSK